MLLAGVVAALDAAYPPALAEPWDAVGLVCGDPAASVRRVLFAVDPVEAVVAEALALEADLLVTHHPLYLRGTSTVAATTAKGRAVHALVRGGCALLAAHTNADSAAPGVSDALADLFGLTGTTPLAPRGDGSAGLGRVGDLPGPVPFAQLLEQAEQVLPRTAWGVRGAGDPELEVRRLAVCGGAGDSLLDAAAAAGAQAYLTSDLRHHAAAEGPEGLALLDAAHWATEWPWLPVAAAALADGTGLHVHVSSLVTDPFCLSSRSTRA